MAKYKTTVTEKDGTKSSGYIENGRSYYDNGKEINAGASVTDSTGKTWTKGGDTTTTDKATTAYDNNSTWESNGRTYVGGVDVGPAGTKIDTSNTGAMTSAGITSNNSGGGSSNPYEQYYREAVDNYSKMNDQILEMNRLAVEQGVNRLEAQKSNVEQAAEDSAREAYIRQMQNERVLPQQLAYKGGNGGLTETAKMGIKADYENSMNDIHKTRINAIQEIDNAIAELKTTGDLAAVEQVLANNQQALNAYMNMLDKSVGYNQWATEYNAGRIDKADSNEYRDRVYNDSLIQQQTENKLNQDKLALNQGELKLKQDQLAYEMAKKAEEEAKVIDEESANALGNAYFSLATQINKAYAGNSTGKKKTDDVIIDDGYGGYTINPKVDKKSYLDLIIARAIDSVNNGLMTNEQAKQFLMQELNISENDISRVASYYIK